MERVSKGYSQFIVGAVAVFVISASAACGGGGGSDDGGDGGGGGGTARVTSFIGGGGVTDGNGEAVFSFDLPEGTNKFSLTSTADALVGTDFVRRGDTVLASFEDSPQLSLAFDFSQFLSTVNMPAHPSGSISAGAHSVGVSAARVVGGDALVPASGLPVSFTLLAKEDPDLTSGTLPLNVILVGAAATAGDTPAIVDEAVDEMTRIYQGQVGITLAVSRFSIDGPAVIPDPDDGSDLYGAISSQVPSPAINICVGIDIEIDGALGVSPGIPGSPVPSAHSCVVVSLLAGAGADGNFSQAEVTLLGETLAHEAGHYTGLRHVFEQGFTGDPVEFDPLDDTETCSNRTDCESRLGNNLMYPGAILDSSGNLVNQNVLTGDQGRIMNAYIVVD